MCDAPIKIELSSVKGPQQSIEEPMDLSVRITNISDKTIWMVGVLPGSEGLRYPLYVAELEGPSGPIEVQLPEGLDYVRGLQPEDFVRLDPGESFDPQGKGFIPIQQFAWFKPTEPGCYRLQLRCDTTAEDPRHWLGHTFVRDLQRVEMMLNQVPKVNLRSNTLELKFD